jgi:hypothetical protein
MNDFPSFAVPATSRLKKILSAVLLLGLLGFTLAPVARAQITINFVYNGTDTVLTYNVAPGSLASLTPSGTAAPSAGHTVANGGLINVTGVSLDVYVNPGFTNSNWGTPSVAATFFSGDEIRFFVGSSGVRVPTGYDRVNGTLAGSMTWTSLSLMGLGFASNNSDSGSFAALGTTVNWSATNTAIPEPGTYALLGGLAALGFAAFRRRAKRAEG